MLLLDLNALLIQLHMKIVLRHTLLNLFKYTHIADGADQIQIKSEQKGRNSCKPKA